MKRKWLASLLALALLLSLFPTVAFAEENESTPAEQCTATEGCTLKESALLQNLKRSLRQSR